MKQALEALEMVTVDAKTTPNAYEASRQAIIALRAAIEQPRQWQDLTEFEKVNIAIDCGCADVAWMDFADAIEANLKEKNT